VSQLSAEERSVAEDSVVRSEGRGWAAVSGLERVKEMLQEAVVEPIKYPDIYTGLRSPPRGVLLFGPPGTGKTMLARAAAQESGATFFCISAASLTSKWMGEAEKNVRALFGAARKLAPSIVFLDEVDALLSKRTASEHDAMRRLKTEFLVQLDGAATSSSSDASRVLVLAATNRPDDLDDALLRRMPQRVYIPLPDAPARTALLRLLLGEIRNDVRDADLDAIVRATDGYSGSDLKELAREAAHAPLREARARGEPLRADTLRPLHVADLLDATRRVRPSVDAAEVAKMEAFERRVGVRG
jgi:SpoVK/Ycf46/Vps4 family AAA+-type ATPase